MINSTITVKYIINLFLLEFNAPFNVVSSVITTLLNNWRPNEYVENWLNKSDYIIWHEQYIFKTKEDKEIVKRCTWENFKKQRKVAYLEIHDFDDYIIEFSSQNNYKTERWHLFYQINDDGSFLTKFSIWHQRGIWDKSIISPIEYWLELAKMLQKFDDF